MKMIVKAALKRILSSLVTVMGGGAFGRYIYGQIVNEVMGRTQKVVHQGISLAFAIPNAVNKTRADEFSIKEPETLAWIDGIPKGAVVWDIGANIGLYACYAAKARGCRVFAFEPSVFNLEFLARNIFINKLTESVTIIPLPLSEELSSSKFNMSSTEWGEALSTFGRSYGYDGQPLCKKFEFSTIGISMDEAAELLRVPPPEYIKMDVDGIEHLILKGGAGVLKNVRGVLVEINDDFPQQAADTARYLSSAGLSFISKQHWEAYAGGPFGNTYNQIWQRKN